MKKTVLNTAEELRFFQEKLNKKINEHIEKVNLEEKIKEIKNLPFSKLKTLFENISPNLFNTKEGKNVIKQYLKTIKENKELKAIYTFNEVLKEDNTSNDPTAYLMVATSLSSTDKKSLNEGMKKLVNIVSEGMRLSNMSVDEINNILEEKNELSEAIDYFATHKQTIKNLNEWANKVKVINDYIKGKESSNSTISEATVSKKEILKSLEENINQEGMSDWEKNVVSDVTLLNLSKGNKSDLFEEYKNKCINSINESMKKDIDVETKSRLSLMEEQIKGKKYNEETFINDLLKLSELNSII